MAQLQLQTTGATLIQNSAIQTIPNVQRESSWIYDTINLINKINKIYWKSKGRMIPFFSWSLFRTCISPQYLSSCCVDYIEEKDKAILYLINLYHNITWHIQHYHITMFLNFNPYLNIRYFIFQINYLDYHKIHLNDKQ